MSSALGASLDYLNSPAALESLRADLYWPKWHSPWWHALLLYEMGEVALIPAPIIEALVAGLRDFPCKIFPLDEGDLAPGLDPFSQTQCHCALGNIYQVLAAWGVEMERELPWIRAWFLRYQMADGGMNCDNAAYRVQDECPSSMVGTIAPFEAVLLHTSRPWTSEELEFLKRGADFLMSRRLVLGSSSRHNAEERESARQWPRLCFPRFYFYDILRGLSALAIWAERSGEKLPASVIQEALSLLGEGPELGVQRQAHGGRLTRLSDGQRAPATSFPLLEEVSAPGPSPYLTRQWQDTRRRLEEVGSSSICGWTRPVE